MRVWQRGERASGGAREKPARLRFFCSSLTPPKNERAAATRTHTAPRACLCPLPLHTDPSTRHTQGPLKMVREPSEREKERERQARAHSRSRPPLPLPARAAAPCRPPYFIYAPRRPGGRQPTRLAATPQNFRPRRRGQLCLCAPRSEGGGGSEKKKTNGRSLSLTPTPVALPPPSSFPSLPPARP